MEFKEFVEQLGETVTAKGQAAVEKVKELKEIAELKSRIAVCEDVIRKNYLEIGQKVYDQRKEAMILDEETFEKQFRSIDNAKKAREELKQKMEEIQK